MVPNAAVMALPAIMGGMEYRRRQKERDEQSKKYVEKSRSDYIKKMDALFAEDKEDFSYGDYVDADGNIVK